MIIVAGRIFVEATDRAAYLEECREVIEAARKSAGCLDFHLAADPLEDDRINIFEQWESLAALEEFRSSGPSGAQAARIRRAQVFQHEVAATQEL